MAPGRNELDRENGLKNFFHAEGETIGLGYALNFRLAITGSQNGGQLPEPVKPLVVHLDGDDAFVFREDFLQPVRQRMNVAQMYGADFFAVLAPHLHRIVDRTVSRSPTDEKGIAFLVAVNFRHWNFLGELP